MDLNHRITGLQAVPLNSRAHLHNASMSSTLRPVLFKCNNKKYIFVKKPCLCYYSFMVDTRFSVSVQIMMTLAHHSDEMLSSDMLAKALKTNPTFVRKLVSKLVCAKLIDSYRGKGGGIKMAKLPSEISLKDIYLASTEDKTLISVHKKPVIKACQVSCCIGLILDDIVNGIEHSTQNFLSKKNLSDLMKSVK
jgi:Rrf2 family protein